MREYDLDEILEEYLSEQPGPADAVSEEAEPLPAEPEAETVPAAEEDGAGEPESLPEEPAEPDEGGAEDAEPDGAGDAGQSQMTQIYSAAEVEKVKQAAAAAAEQDAPKKKKKKKKKHKKESIGARIGFALLSLLFAAVSLVCLAWSLENLHPDTQEISDASRPTGSTNLVTRLDTALNNAKADALSDIAFIPKHYTIPEGETVAPKPAEANFGSVSPADAAAVMDVIQLARDSGLLEGQEMIFRPDLNFEPHTDIQYYRDETILTILWKELIDGNTVTCCEVKVADASQFRRKFVDDTFGSPRKLFATSIAASVNAVVAMNADFYMFRDFGIVVYDRELYRFSEDTYTGSYKKYNCTDTMFVTDQGDFKFWHRLEEANADQMRAYIRDNNILFSIAFGPVLVENGELQVCDWYPAGEIDRGYSRAGIGQKDHLHYFYMSLNHSPQKEARWNVNYFGQKMYERGLQQAYCLDGGQTGEIVWRGAPFNYIDYGMEREVSDVMYFATAIPEAEVTP